MDRYDLVDRLRPAIAQTVVAQYEPGGTLPVATHIGTGVPYGGTASQTFTSQDSGTLYSASVWISQFQSDPLPTNIVAEIRTTTSGLTDTGGGAVVATTSVLGSSAPTYASPNYITFDFSSSGYSLISGNVYALVLSANGGSGGIAWYGQTGGYSGGALYNWSGSEFTIATPSSLDAKFNVSVSVIPEPSTYAGIFGGIALLALWVGKRRA